MVEIKLYQYTGQRNTVNKQLDVLKTLEGTLKDYFNYMNPTITLRMKTDEKFNYCYISSFNRYYFIDDIIVRDNGTFEYVLTLDVLKTYEQEIMTATGETVTSTDGDPYSSNRDSAYSVKPNFEKIEFPNKGLFNEDGTIIMVTIKGNDLPD